MPAPPLPVPDTTRRTWTVEERNVLPDDGNRYEVVDGELLVTPAPSLPHQRAAFQLALSIESYTARLGLECVIAPADVTFSPRRVVEPDVFVIPLHDGRLAARFEDVGRLVLAIEVLSPSSARADRHVKRGLYQSQGVPEYWMVDVEERVLERWRPGDMEATLLRESVAWQPLEGVEPLVIDLRAYFSRVHGA